jgi:hypothetical protein
MAWKTGGGRRSGTVVLSDLIHPWHKARGVFDPDPDPHALAA